MFVFPMFPCENTKFKVQNKYEVNSGKTSHPIKMKIQRNLTYNMDMKNILVINTYISNLARMAMHAPLKQTPSGMFIIKRWRSEII